MSERIHNKKQNFGGIDPQESLIKSLESIKSLLKQGDSKISEARENIARADDISSASESQLNTQNSEIRNTAFTSSDSIQMSDIPELLDSSVEQNLNVSIKDDFEEIIVEDVQDNNIFKNTSNLVAPEIEPDKTTPKKSGNALNELYDHDLIVPMLDEIVMPEEQNSSLFNMDSAIDIKLSPEFKSALLETDDNKQIKSAYNNIQNTEVNTKADIISFELSSNNIKKNNLKKKNSLNAESEKVSIDLPKVQKNISLAEGSKIDIQPKNKQDIQDKSNSEDNVVIKETTSSKSKKSKKESIISTKSTTNSVASSVASKVKTAANLETAIDSTNHTDDVLKNITNTESIKQVNSVQDINTTDEIDFSKIDGLGNIKFNAEKISSLQKRVESRVHSRLIQLVVQLDDEIKNIFTDEIKNCIAKEIESNTTKNEK